MVQSFEHGGQDRSYFYDPQTAMVCVLDEVSMKWIEQIAPDEVGGGGLLMFEAGERVVPEGMALQDIDGRRVISLNQLGAGARWISALIEKREGQSQGRESVPKG